MKLSFELAQEEDAEKLIEVQNLCFYADFVQFGECPGFQVPLEEMKERIRNPYLFKILLDGRIIGDITVRPKGEGRYWLGCLAVIPEFQNRGIGSRAMEFVEQSFPGAISWGLDTPVQKAGNCHFYEKLGFVGIEDRIYSEKLTLRLYEKKLK